MAAMDHDRRNKQPRMLTESERDRLEEFIESIHYSSRCAPQHVQVHGTVADELQLDIPMTSSNIGMFNFPRRWSRKYQKTTLIHRRGP